MLHGGFFLPATSSHPNGIYSQKTDVFQQERYICFFDVTIPQERSLLCFAGLTGTWEDGVT
jgi:hypothetical protein